MSCSIFIWHSSRCASRSIASAFIRRIAGTAEHHARATDPQLAGLLPGDTRVGPGRLPAAKRSAGDRLRLAPGRCGTLLDAVQAALAGSPFHNN